MPLPPSIPMPLRTLQDLVRSLRGGGAASALIAFGADSVERWSFGELASAVEQTSAALLARGLRQGEPVAIYAPNSPRWAAVFLAAVNAGAVAMPLDDRTDEEDLARQLSANDCRWIATTARHAARLEDLWTGDRRVITLDRDSTPGAPSLGWNDLSMDERLQPPQAEAGDIAVLLHTSGTTGTPKAVPLTHANLVSNIAALLSERLVEEGDRVLLPLPFHHVYPLTIGLLTPLAARAAIVLPGGLSGPELARALREGEVTHLLGVPRLYDGLLAEIHGRAAARGDFARRSFRTLLALSSWLRRTSGLRIGRILFPGVHRRLAPKLRLVVSGGAALGAETEKQLEALGWEVLSGYGLTETSPILTFNLPRAKRVGSAGLPLPGVEVRIANPGADGVGEIDARGTSVFAGYRNDPETTAEAFTADGWFRTGDLGYLDRDGFLHIAARLKETIVLPNGKKIFPEAVEDVYGRSPLIRELAVLSHGGSLVALVSPNEEALRMRGAARAEQLIREDLMERGSQLPSYERLGGFAVVHEPLPRTHIGKLRRHLLEPLYIRAREHRAPPTRPSLSAADHALLENPVAARLWAWIQNRFPDRPLSLDTSPQIDLGLDSLSWVDVTLEMDRALGVTLTEAATARVVTVRDLLREAVSAASAAPVTALGRPSIPEAESRGHGHALAHRTTAALNRVLMRRLFDLRVQGSENLPPHGPFILCPNHASYLDPFAVAAALPYRLLRETWWAGWTALLFAGPLSRAFSRIVQVVPVDPDRAVASGLAGAGAVLDRDRCLVWFPEGARSYDGALQTFSPGVGILIGERSVPVVPVAIAGTFDAWPRQRRFPRLRPVAVAFGQPMEREAFIVDGRMTDPARAAALIRERIDELLRRLSCPRDRSS